METKINEQIVANYQTSARKKRAEFLAKLLSGYECEIAKAIAQYPELTDTSLGIKIGIDRRIIRTVRERNQIPCVCYVGMGEEPELYKRLCFEDDRKLDAGVCEVNLFGEERKRYLTILSEKKQGKRR